MAVKHIGILNHIRLSRVRKTNGFRREGKREKYARKSEREEKEKKKKKEESKK